MKATTLDLRRHPGDIIRALDRNETVVLIYRGKEKGIIRPLRSPAKKGDSLTAHPAFGMWKGRTDLRDVIKHVRSLRKGRKHAV